MSDRETIAVYAMKLDDCANLKIGRTERAAMNIFCEGFAVGAKILDLGCGPGLHARAFLDKGFDVRALDATAEFVHAARSNGIDAHIGTFDDLKEIAIYDGIWASFSLLHAPKANFLHHLQSCHRALCSGGHMYLGMKVGFGERRDHLGRFYAFYTEEELRTLLHSVGFRNLKSHTGTSTGLAGTSDPYVLINAHA